MSRTTTCPPGQIDFDATSLGNLYHTEKKFQDSSFLVQKECTLLWPFLTKALNDVNSVCARYASEQLCPTWYSSCQQP